MGRGVSSGGGQSSLGYLLGNGEAPAPTQKPAAAEAPAQNPAPAVSKGESEKTPADVSKQIPAGIQGNQKNNYYRADGQNTGNFLTV